MSVLTPRTTAESWATNQRVSKAAAAAGATPVPTSMRFPGVLPQCAASAVSALAAAAAVAAAAALAPASASTIARTAPAVGELARLLAEHVGSWRPDGRQPASRWAAAVLDGRWPGSWAGLLPSQAAVAECFKACRPCLAGGQHRKLARQLALAWWPLTPAAWLPPLLPPLPVQPRDREAPWRWRPQLGRGGQGGVSDEGGAQDAGTRDGSAGRLGLHRAARASRRVDGRQLQRPGSACCLASVGQC